MTKIKPGSKVRVSRSALLDFAAAGEVSMSACVWDRVPDDDDALEVPGSWFQQLRYSRETLDPAQTEMLPVSRGGFLFFSCVGFLSFKRELREAFEASGGDWSLFEAAAAEHFARLRRGLERQVSRARAELARAEAALADHQSAERVAAAQSDKR